MTEEVCSGCEKLKHDHETLERKYHEKVQYFEALNSALAYQAEHSRKCTEVEAEQGRQRANKLEARVKELEDLLKKYVDIVGHHRRSRVVRDDIGLRVDFLYASDWTLDEWNIWCQLYPDLKMRSQHGRS